MTIGLVPKLCLGTRCINPHVARTYPTNMLFHTWVFFVFFLIVFPVYLLVRKNNRLMNIWLMIASYTFYGWWNPWYLLLLFGTSAIDYWHGPADGTQAEHAQALAHHQPGQQLRLPRLTSNTPASSPKTSTRSCRLGWPFAA